MICVSLSGISFNECLESILKYEFTEVRIDLLQLTADQLSCLFAKKRKTIATCRPGPFDNKQRMALLKLAIDAGASYIDVEYEADIQYREELTTYAKSCNVKVIISYHNFENTPTFIELEDIIGQSRAMKSDIVKITTTAILKSDCSVVMSLYAKYDNIIAFCMGETGKITRVAAPFLGAVFTYAAWNKKMATAPGQLTVDELNEIYNILK